MPALAGCKRYLILFYPKGHAPIMASDIATEKLGRYEILSELGQGAMGVVYKAIDPLIDRIVAIKTIKFDGSNEETASFEERFYREAKSAGRLNHPHIVTIYDVGKSADTAYIAMEYLEGEQLKAILDVHTPMSIERIADIGAQIAEGLAYAHKNGIVHRDIKPANVMLLQGDRVKITDFGIAHMSTSSGTLAGTVLGSPRYMAPEQVVGKTVDGRSDVFALGVLLYEMLTGESPFDGDNINTTMYRIVNEAPVPPKTLAPRIPEAFDYIVAKALAKHPDARYQNATEMAHDLRHYQELAIPTAEITPLYHPITVERRNFSDDRRARNINPAGEATVILAPPGEVTSASALIDSEPEAIQPAPSLQALHKANQMRILGVSMILLLGFGLSLLIPAKAPGLIKRPLQSAVNPPVTGHAASATPSGAPASTMNLPTPIEPPPLLPVVPLAPAPFMEPVRKETSKPIKPRLAIEEGVAVAPKPAPVAKAKATLNFAVSPWGDIYVDGKRMGASPPLNELQVSAGTHKIEIRNQNFAPYRQTLHLQADSTKKLKHRFE